MRNIFGNSDFFVNPWEHAAQQWSGTIRVLLAAIPNLKKGDSK